MLNYEKKLFSAVFTCPLILYFRRNSNFNINKFEKEKKLLKFWRFKYYIFVFLFSLFS